MFRSMIVSVCLVVFASICAAEPPVIILKLDDLGVSGKNSPIHTAWLRAAEYIEKNGLKASFGIICKSLEVDNPKYVAWLKGLHERGNIELWCHGYTHDVHKEADGKEYAEFTGRPYEVQLEHLMKATALAREKLGFELATFGPGGGGNSGSFDAATIRAVHDTPDLKIWLYPQAIDKQGQELEAKGKVVVLDRVFQVNIEAPLFVPSAEKLIAGYTKFAAQRKYFVMQGHPTHWKPEGWTEFEKTIDYLRGQGCRFMTPSEYVRQMRKQ
jgi:peptidoglycan/xylan/chitin deacetylase (PgdA/CDA1 family)